MDAGKFTDLQLTVKLAPSARTAVTMPASPMSESPSHGVVGERILRKAVKLSVKRKYIDFVKDHGATAYRAWKHFRTEHPNVQESQVRQWLKKKDEIEAGRVCGARVAGAGRPPLSRSLEDVLFEFIFQMRMQKHMVKKSLIKKKALDIANEMGILDFRASDGWLRRFFSRYDLTLRRATNLTRLSDIDVVQRAVSYFSYLRSVRKNYSASNVVLMDETAVFFETTRTSTVDVVGARHVVLRTTGFASMRITSMLAVRGNGTRVMPANIFKGAREEPAMLAGCYTFTQPNAWVDSKLLCRWIDLVLPRVIRGNARGLLIWDASRAHISKEVKAHCRSVNVDMAVIPGGMTAYLQAGDLCFYKPFKDVLNTFIEEWKSGPDIQYTARGNPRPPPRETVNNWVRSSWRCIDTDLIKKGLLLAGLSGEVRDTFIANHDIYGENVMDAWRELQNAGQVLSQTLEPDREEELVIAESE